MQGEEGREGNLAKERGGEGVMEWKRRQREGRGEGFGGRSRKREVKTGKW